MELLTSLAVISPVTTGFNSSIGVGPRSKLTSSGNRLDPLLLRLVRASGCTDVRDRAEFIGCTSSDRDVIGIMLGRGEPSSIRTVLSAYTALETDKLLLLVRPVGKFNIDSPEERSLARVDIRTSSEKLREVGYDGSIGVSVVRKGECEGDGRCVSGDSDPAPLGNEKIVPDSKLPGSTTTIGSKEDVGGLEGDRVCEMALIKSLSGDGLFCGISSVNPFDRHIC